MNPPAESPETLVETLISLQREEQAAILDRQPHQLPVLGRQIDEVVGRLDQLGPPAIALRPRLRLVQELAEQNQLLLLHHLRAVQAVLAHVFPETSNPVYDALGRMRARVAEAGALLTLRT